MDLDLYYAHQIPTLLMLVYMRTSSFQHWLRLHTYTLPWFLTYFNEIFYVLGINKTYITAFLLNTSVKQGAVKYDIKKKVGVSERSIRTQVQVSASGMFCLHIMKPFILP